MKEPPIEKVVPEEDFRALLAERAVALLETCAAPGDSAWTKRRFFDISVEADELEAFLDDYGARTNRQFSAFTEIVASIRGFTLAGLSLTHLVRRLGTYGVLESLGDRRAGALDDLGMALQFVEAKLAGLMRALLDVGREIGVTELTQGQGQAPLDRTVRRFRLPHNVDLDRIEDEEQRIAEVATKYLDAVALLAGVQIRRIEDEDERERFMVSQCSEVDARVWESTIHNLQSSYDTYVKNTVLETGDPRLKTLRGHISAALHTLQAVTHLTHFVERHDRGLRSDTAEAAIQGIVPRLEVRDTALNRLLVWAWAFIESGQELASALLPSYTNASEATLQLREGIHLHARPASLVVAVVQRHGTPVELEVAGNVCNAGSILELMVAIGSNPEAREYLVRGDERPLRDLVALFAADLGESGLEGLPDSLSYLRPKR
ncbi:MAG: phosphotransferase system HPr-like phosphotransfer protein [Planctomycetota bacterium]|jgi:phosphotransferase system HPr-like phosphotransfer protein